MSHLPVTTPVEAFPVGEFVIGEMMRVGVSVVQMEERLLMPRARLLQIINWDNPEVTREESAAIGSMLHINRSLLRRIDRAYQLFLSLQEEENANGNYADYADTDA